ncbi:hypothetical protein JCM24511_02277 [Saitozyma sp. JCM 24511]|nr:hypothetical protein JCM24511_02277 [Saitozyma sp. JCM 24511]
MPSSEDSGSSTPEIDISIIHDIRPGLFKPPRNSISPPRPRRIKSYRSIRRDGREHSPAEQQYFILELHQRLLRVIADRNALGEVESPPRYIQLAKTPFNWSHYVNVPNGEGSEGMDLDDMDKLEEEKEKLFQIQVKALLALYDTDPNKFFRAITEMNKEARELTEEPRAVAGPSAQVVEMIRKDAAAGLDPSQAAPSSTDTTSVTNQKRPFFAMLEVLNLTHRLQHRDPGGLLRRIALWRSSSNAITESALKKEADPILGDSTGEGSQGKPLGPTTKSRLLPDPKPWVPFGTPSASDRPIEKVVETRPLHNLRTDLLDPKRTEFTNDEIQALTADINRIRVIMAARQELELVCRRGGDTAPEVVGRLSMELDTPGLERAWTHRPRDQSDRDWRMQIINQLCESGSTWSEHRTAGERNDNRPSSGTRLPYFPYQMNPRPETGVEEWRARRDDFGTIDTERAAKRSRPVSLLRPY